MNPFQCLTIGRHIFKSWPKPFVKEEDNYHWKKKKIIMRENAPNPTVWGIKPQVILEPHIFSHQRNWWLIPQPPPASLPLPWDSLAPEFLPSVSLFSSCPFTASFLPAPSQPPFFHPPAPCLSWPFHQGAFLLSSDPYHNSEGLGVVFWGWNLSEIMGNRFEDYFIGLDLVIVTN